LVWGMIFCGVAVIYLAQKFVSYRDWFLAETTEEQSFVEGMIWMWGGWCGGCFFCGVARLLIFSGAGRLLIF